MNPETAGTEEQGPNRVPFINDPDKPSSRGRDEQLDDQEDEAPAEDEPARL